MYNQKGTQDCSAISIIHRMHMIVAKLSDTASESGFKGAMCSWCPYNCATNAFCYDRFLEDKQMYIKMLEELFMAYYSNEDVFHFRYFRTRICKICGDSCSYVYSGHPCAKNYLSQFKKTTADILTFRPNGIKETKIEVKPTLTVGGSIITAFINKLWKTNQGDITIKN